MGATELFHEIQHTDVSAAGMAPALTVTQLFDSIAIRINGPKAWNERLRINWIVTATGRGDGAPGYRMELSNGALIHFPTAAPEEADLTVTLTKPQLIGLLLAGSDRGGRDVGRSQRAGDPGRSHRHPRPRLCGRHPVAGRQAQDSPGLEPPATS